MSPDVRRIPKEAEIVRVEVAESNFLNEKNAYGYIAAENGKAIGFAYGYVLNEPDGQKVYYLHAIDVMEGWQKQGYILKFGAPEPIKVGIKSNNTGRVDMVDYEGVF